MKSKNLILIPTYNESQNVKDLIKEISAENLDIDLLFVDDNSPDGTGRILDNLSNSNSNINIIHREKKLGIGSAHKCGIDWAYDNGYKNLITMDSDFTHKPEYLNDFLKESKNYDIVVGSRYILKESLREWSLLRRILTLTANFLTKILLNIKHDATGAFRLYNLQKIPRELFKLIESEGYSFFFESLYILNINKFSIKEIPIELPARTYGSTKMKTSDAIKSLLQLGTLFIQRLFTKKKVYKINNSEISIRRKEIKDWDNYWENPKGITNNLYGIIANFYRNKLIKPNLNKIVKKHFPEKSKLLHAGCGSGKVDKDFSMNHSIFALDMSNNALKVYRSIHNTQEEIIQGTIFSIPTKNFSFDGIYHLGVMEHFTKDEIKQILSEFERILKNDGKMIVFWPPKFGLSVIALKIIHFMLNKILRLNIKLHPDEITLIESKKHAQNIFSESNFKIIDYSFGYYDLFTYCMLVVQKDKKEKNK